MNEPPPIDYPPILFNASFIYGLIYAGTIIFVVSAILFLLAFKEVTEGYIKYWDKILHYSLEVMIVSGLSTFIYITALFGLCNAYYALEALAITFIGSMILAITTARKIDNMLRERL
ncbi:MAG: hypothetical protein QW270_01400 [Candidatus Bathyarchaeia archaeon]